MTSHSSAPAATVGIFDIETVLDEAAAAAAGYKGGRIRPALQRVATACLLTARENTDGTWTAFAIETLTSPLSEFDILMRLDRSLETLAETGGRLVTYNGRKHDLSVIRRRAARHWMFGLPGISAAGQIDHLDVMMRQTGGRPGETPTLREACAALGISAFNPRSPDPQAPKPDVQKCQIDVVATFLLMLYELAIERGSPDVILAGWNGLSNYLAAQRPRAVHLEHFRNHPILRAGQKAQAPISTSRCDDLA